MPPPDIVLLSTYELGHQPLALAWPLAFLQQAGLSALAVDLSLQAFPVESIATAKLIGISMPMHTAARLGVSVVAQVRAVNPSAHVCAFGLYAHLNAETLRAHGVDSILAGEYETALCDLALAVLRGKHPAAQSPHLLRQTFPLPQRETLPTLERYARYQHNGHEALSGYAEASRGCLHTCRHCPIVPVYTGRFFIVPPDIVLADIRQQVAAGAAHITFGDPDFLNGPRHALALARALHAEWSTLTFDFTTKVEHILQHRALFAEFAALGCTFVVSAIESISDTVLTHLHKGHTAADIDTALAILDAAGLALQPTLVAFTPWTTLEGYIAQVNYLFARGLLDHVPPVQLAIRLLLPPQSPLLQTTEAWLGEFDAEALGYRWTHPDPRLDALWAQVQARVEYAEETDEAPLTTHLAIRALAYAQAGQRPPTLPAARLRPTPPRLTEDWFC